MTYIILVMMRGDKKGKEKSSYNSEAARAGVHSTGEAAWTKIGPNCPANWAVVTVKSTGS